MTPRPLHAVPPPIRVRLTVEPDPRRTVEWLRDLIGKAKQWKAEREGTETEAA